MKIAMMVTMLVMMVAQFVVQSPMDTLAIILPTNPLSAFLLQALAYQYVVMVDGTQVPKVVMTTTLCQTMAAARIAK